MPGHGFRSASPTERFAGFMPQPGGRWWLPRRCARNFPCAGFRIWFPGIGEWTPIDSGRGIKASSPFRRPIYLYVGRLAVEKNIRAFLDLKLEGTKLVVGDGPELESLASEYPEAQFTRAKFGEELAQYFAASDVFVFPSRTDTFGLVILEALASGIPVAAYPVTGPKDVIGNSRVGVLSEDLGQAAIQCLKISPRVCREYALQFSWKACAEVFCRATLSRSDTGKAIAESSPFGRRALAHPAAKRDCGDDSNPRPGRSAVRRASSSKRFAQDRRGPAALNKRPAGSTRSEGGAGRTSRPRETVRL